MARREAELRRSAATDNQIIKATELLQKATSTEELLASLLKTDSQEHALFERDRSIAHPGPTTRKTAGHSTGRFF